MVVFYKLLASPRGGWSNPLCSTNSSKIGVGPFPAATLLSPTVTCSPLSLMSRIVPVVVWRSGCHHHWCRCFPGDSWDEVGLWIWRNSGKNWLCCKLYLIWYIFSQFSIFFLVSLLRFLFDVFGTSQRSVGTCFDGWFLNSEPRDLGFEGEQNGMR